MSHDAVDTASLEEGDGISVNLSKPPITPCAGKREGFYPPFFKGFLKGDLGKFIIFHKKSLFLSKKVHFLTCFVRYILMKIPAWKDFQFHSEFLYIGTGCSCMSGFFDNMEISRFVVDASFA